jgi:hypothetical protein
MPESHMSSDHLEATIPAAGAAVAQDQVIDRSAIGGTVTSVLMVPEAALTANATNYRTFRVVNKGQNGAGSTVIASFATDTPTTDDLVAFDEKTVPLVGTPTVAAGDIIAVDETVTGTGVAHSGYRIDVEIVR